LAEVLRPDDLTYKEASWYNPIEVTAITGGAILATHEMIREWQGSEQLDELFRNNDVVRSGNALTLDDHCVIADENGDAIEEFMGYADTAFEELSQTTWVRKFFEIDDPEIAEATLCIAGEKLRGSGTLAGTFNGVPFTARAAHNCAPWYNYWVLCRLPAAPRRGRNELILHTTGSLVWRLFIVPSMLPNRSAKSIDSGLNWDDEHLGLGGFIDGEYVIRLSGKRFAAQGKITSPPVQVLPNRHTVAPSGRLAKLQVTADCPVKTEVRLGTGPWLDASGHWTPWTPLTSDTAGQLEKLLEAAGPRFLQFRLTLQRGRRGVPMLKRLVLRAKLDSATPSPPPAVKMVCPISVLPGRPFAHQRPSEKLQFYREHFELDKVFNQGTDTWDSLMRLAAWLGDYCTNRVNGVELIPNPVYETHFILELGHEKRTAVHCGALAFALVQIAAAFGLTGRVIFRGNHLVSEFWSPGHRKWAVVDPMDQLPNPQTGVVNVWTGGFGGYYVQDDGIPMSSIELGQARGRITRRHFVWKTGRYEEREATVPRDLRWFRREISYPERNNYTDATEPLFRADVFRYANHLKLRRPGQKPMPWYGHYTSRRGDIEWTVGETGVFLTALPNGNLLAQLRSQMPNTEGWVVNGKNQNHDSFQWDIQETRCLTVHAVNAWGQAGPDSQCCVE
jgi:hypothetical protein